MRAYCMVPSFSSPLHHQSPSRSTAPYWSTRTLRHAGAPLPKPLLEHPTPAPCWYLPSLLGATAAAAADNDDSSHAEPCRQGSYAAARTYTADGPSSL
eukprot:1158040-Pelagomonas_calceolata.AAC.6